MSKQLSKTKIGRLINSFTDIDESRTGTCKSLNCETLSGLKYNACCKLGFFCPFLSLDKKKCSIHAVRVRNCRDRKSTRLNSSHIPLSRMPSSA